VQGCGAGAGARIPGAGTLEPAIFGGGGAGAAFKI